MENCVVHSFCISKSSSIAGQKMNTCIIVIISNLVFCLILCLQLLSPVLIVVLLLMLIQCCEPQGSLLMRFNWRIPLQTEEKFGKIAINDGLHLVQSVFVLLALHLKDHPHYAELVTLFAKVRLFSFGKPCPYPQ